MLIVALVAGSFTPAVLYVGAVNAEVCASEGPWKDGESAFKYMVTALSFVLVFRLNRSAARHWEARQLCGWVMIHCRDLAISSTAALSAHPDTRDRLCEVSVAFPVCFMLHMWGNPQGRTDALLRMLDGVFADEATLEMLKAAKHRPLALIEYAQTILHAHFLRPDAPAASTTPAAGNLYLELLRTARGLGQPLGGCERIIGTPLPFAYVAHVRSFLVVVLCGIPLVYVCDWGWATVPLSLLIAFGLLGIEAASVECERPFSATPTKNHHDLEKFCSIVTTEVTEMLERAAARV